MLFIEQIFGSKVGVVTLDLPTGESISGLCTEDSLKLSFKNNWASILPEVSTLQELSQIFGQQNMISWISASKAGWKGTDPVFFGLEFYMFSWKHGVSIKSKIKPLLKLASIDEGASYIGGTDSSFTVKVHGGYTASFAQSNEENFNGNISDTQPGLITLSFGDQIVIPGLLLESVEPSSSSVQVAPNTPLFIKVNASFRGFRACLSSDIDRMF